MEVWILPKMVLITRILQYLMFRFHMVRPGLSVEYCLLSPIEYFFGVVSFSSIISSRSQKYHLFNFMTIFGNELTFSEALNNQRDDSEPGLILEMWRIGILFEIVIKKCLFVGVLIMNERTAAYYEADIFPETNFVWGLSSLIRRWKMERKKITLGFYLTFSTGGG